MKKLVKIILVAAVAVTLVLFGGAVASAAEAEESYTVTQDGEEYILACGGASLYRGTSLGDAIAAAGGHTLTFDSVSTDASVTLTSGEYVFDGVLTLTGGASLTVDGATLTIDGASIAFGTGTLRVKRGSLTVLGGSVCSESTAITLDFYATASLTVSGGQVCSQTSSAILLREGSAAVCGGTVRSSLSYAIDCSSTLFLSGAPTLSGVGADIVTDCAITLSYGGAEYSGGTRVKFLSDFEVGRATAVFYADSADSLDKITLFDKSGTELPLSFFEGGEYAFDESVGAVRLPFYVTYTDGDGTVTVREYIEGDAVSPPAPSEREGYVLEGWYTESGEPYDFSGELTSDLTLYARYRLIPPTYTLISESFVYDGNVHLIKISDICHPLLSEGFLTFAWYKDGAPLSSYDSEHGVRTVADGGSYHAVITFTVGKDSVTLTTPPAAIEITPATVIPPTADPAGYTGYPISSGLSDTDVYTVAYTEGVAVGIYPVPVTLRDAENYRFEGTRDTTVYVDFAIERAENEWTTPLSISDIYTGGIPAPVAVSRFGAAEYFYAPQNSSSFTATPPTEAGVWQVRASVAATENYHYLESAPVTFVIIEECVTGISVKNPADKLSYIAFEPFLPQGIEVEVAYNSGRTELVGEGSLSFSYQSASDSFRYGDSGVTVWYGDARVTLHTSVARADYDISSVVFAASVVEYDGTYKTLPPPTVLPVGLDGVPLAATVKGGGIEAGAYTVTLTFKSESENYRTPAPLTATLTVMPRSVRVIWSDTEFTYDGTAKMPSAFYTDILGRKIALTVVGARSAAGSYIAEASVTDPNYTLENPTASFTVNKARYDTSGVRWCGGGEVYDGTEKSVYLSGLPSGVGVLGYVNNRAVSVGAYTAKASLSYDSQNYEEPSVPELEWRILAAEYDLSGFSFGDSEVTFDGEWHYPVLNGVLPTGADGIALEYAFDRGVRDVKDGRCAVTVSFCTTSRNYNAPASITRYVTVLPLGVAVSWSGLSVTYDGTAKVPTAACAECGVTVTGAATDAGEYTATATADDPNYTVINSTAAFVIERAENRWLLTPTVSDIFFGRVPSPAATARAGEVAFVYYLDEGGEYPVDEAPRAVGTYYVRAVCEGDRNHLPISSEIMKFDIIAVVPVSLEISLSDYTFSAFDTVGAEHLAATLLYNDQSAEPLPYPSVTIAYENGDSFRYGDTRVTFSYDNFVVSTTVTVVRADYDLSSVRWENTLVIYDGTEKSAYLTGLPDGVAVTEYIGNRATVAGEYEISATLSYDEENYNPPIIPSATLTVAKRTVILPSLPAVIYDGAGHTPAILDTDLYTLSYTERVSAVGKYAVTLTLRDGANYTFSSGAAEATVDFVIKPRPITVTVGSVELYLFEDGFTPSFEITEGELVYGDVLTPVYDVRDGKIYALFDAPSYEITVIAGSVVHNGRLSPTHLSVILVILLVLLLLTLTVFLLLRYRMRIYLACRALICRHSFANTPALAEEPIPASAPTPTAAPPECEAPQEIAEPEISVPVSAEYADGAITNSLAKELIRRDETVVTSGFRRGIINVDTLSGSFSAGDRVDINILKRRSLVPYDTAYIKVLARGVIDKPLDVYANDFSLAAVKMIALSGGKAVKVSTVITAPKDKID